MLRLFKWLFVSICVFLVACGGTDSGQTTGATSNVSQQTFKWKMVTTWPANFPIFQEGAEKFAADVKIMSQGCHHYRYLMPCHKAQLRWDMAHPITGPARYLKHNSFHQSPLA